MFYKTMGFASMATIAASVFLFAPAQAAGKSCVLAGGEATMMTRDLAEFMAKAALGNSIKAKDLKPTGAVKLSCKDPAPLTYCLAEQRACK
jgi:DNA transposition AAA+ family ATPase